MYTNIKTLAKLNYQRMWGEHSGEQISDQRCPDQLYHSMWQHSDATANRNKYTNVTFLVGALFEQTYLFRWAWTVTEQNDRMEYWVERWCKLHMMFCVSCATRIHSFRSNQSINKRRKHMHVVQLTQNSVCSLRPADTLQNGAMLTRRKLVVE